MLSIVRRSKKKRKSVEITRIPIQKNCIVRIPPVPKRIPIPKNWKPPRIQPIVKKELTNEEFNNWLSTASGFVEGLTKDMSGIESQLYDYQIEHLENDASFRHIDKARQVGFSYTFACEALAKSHLKNLQTSIFISYNQEEANEKIRFSKALYDSLPTKFQRKLIVDNKQSLEFEHKGYKTRILSFAQRQPRGKGNNTDVYLDEFAHMMWADKIYVASLPVITRGSGVLTLASTPLGKGSLHYEISNDKKKYNMFSRMKIFWWDCPELCVDVEEARKIAPFLSTRERVASFATQKLKYLFEALNIDDFMQEYELHYLDESISYFPLSIIKACVFEDENKTSLEPNIDPDEAETAWEDNEDSIMSLYKENNINWFYDSTYIAGEVEEDAILKVMNIIDNMLNSMEKYDFGRELLLGIDIGRKRDTSEISIFEQIELSTHNIHVERISIELSNVKFKLQEKIIRTILKSLPIKKAKIDKTGIGMNLAENIEDDYPNIVEGVEFSYDNKSEMAKNFRFRLEDRAIAIYNDVSSIKQIHSIKKTVTESSNVKYGAEKNREHHGDKFWAKALASSCGDNYDRSKIIKSVFRFGENRVFNQQQIIRSPNSTPLYKNTMNSIMRKNNLDFEIERDMNGIFFDTKYYL